MSYEVGQRLITPHGPGQYCRSSVSKAGLVSVTVLLESCTQYHAFRPEDVHPPIEKPAKRTRRKVQSGA